jgi:hypothetical protein
MSVIREQASPQLSLIQLQRQLTECCSKSLDSYKSNAPASRNASTNFVQDVLLSFDSWDAILELWQHLHSLSSTLLSLRIADQVLSMICAQQQQLIDSQSKTASQEDPLPGCNMTGLCSYVEAQDLISDSNGYSNTNSTTQNNIRDQSQHDVSSMHAEPNTPTIEPESRLPQNYIQMHAPAQPLAVAQSRPHTTPAAAVDAAQASAHSMVHSHTAIEGNDNIHAHGFIPPCDTALKAVRHTATLSAWLPPDAPATPVFIGALSLAHVSVLVGFRVHCESRCNYVMLSKIYFGGFISLFSFFSYTYLGLHSAFCL